MKIFVCNPPFLPRYSRPQRSPAVTKSGTLYYPLFLASTAGVLEEDGFQVDFVDAPAEGLDRPAFLSRAEDFHPDLVVMETSTPSFHNDREVMVLLKKRLPRALMAMVGTHVSALPEEALQPDGAVDVVVRGEYEYTVRDLARALRDGRDWQNLRGTSFLRDAEEVVHNPEGEWIADLDALPFVSRTYRKHLDIRNYFNPNALYPMVTIISSRGCPFSCDFCLYPQVLTGNRLRCRSPGNLVEEMAYICEAFPGVKSIFFEDDTFTSSRKRCLEISDLILKRGVKISWTTNARADLDYEELSLMKAAGCRSLCVGFESASREHLQAVHKGTRVERMFDFMASAREAGILIHGCFMVGFPGETRETMEQTLQLALKLKPDTIQVYPMMVYPGTRSYRWFKEHDLLLTENYRQWLTDKGLHNCVIRTEDVSSEELLQFCYTARRRFYLRPGYLLYKMAQVCRHPAELVRTLKALKTFIRHL